MVQNRSKLHRNFRNEHIRTTPFDPKLTFLDVSNRFVTARKSVRNGPNRCHYHTNSPNEIAPDFFRNEGTRSTTLDPKLIYCGCFELFRYCTKLGAKWAEQVPLPHKFVNKVELEFFATNELDPLHLTQNSCFSAF
jgi:hypothetical protein